MMTELPGYSQDLDIIKEWKYFYIEKHPIGQRIIILWENNEIRYLSSDLKELDSIHFFEYTFALKYALINSNLKGEWVFDVIISDSICTITDFDEKTTLTNLFGVLEYSTRRHSLITLLKSLPKKTVNIKVCSSEKLDNVEDIKINSEYNNIIKPEDSYSFCSENLRILIS